MSIRNCYQEHANTYLETTERSKYGWSGYLKKILDLKTL